MTCKNCGCEFMMKAKWEVQWTNHVEEIYEERCPMCQNLLFGYSKPKEGTFRDKLNGVRNKFI